MLESAAALISMIVSQLFPQLDGFKAAAICLAVYASILANMIHLFTAFLTRLASIFLVGAVHDIHGNYILYFYVPYKSTFMYILLS